MGLFSFFLSRLSRHRMVWIGTPETFLGAVLYFQKKNNPVYSTSEVLLWAMIMRKIIKVNLLPYKNFSDLLLLGVPDYSIAEEIEQKMVEKQQRIDLKKALYGENADLGDDDVLNSNSEDSVFVRKTLKRISPYVKFREEREQRKMDELRKP